MGGHAPATAQDAGFTVSAVARRLGIAAATLRTWDRRYGMSPSLRTAGSHRRYTAGDLARLERMQAFMVTGMPPGDAAKVCRGQDAPYVMPDPAAAATGSGAAAQRGLARAAGAMDTTAAAGVIRRCIKRNGVTWTWDHVIAAVLRSVCTEPGSAVEVEHHLSHVVICELGRCSHLAQPVNPRPVILASAPQEYHSLPLYALAAALAERGIACRMLGASTPDEALAAAVRRTGPVAVFIWAHAATPTDLAVAVPAIRPTPQVVVGGPGWSAVSLPADVPYPQHLAEAVAVLASAVRPVPQ